MGISLTAPKTFKSPARLFNILITLLCLSSCASNRAPVQELTAANSTKLTHHVVSRGETLYAIAWRYGLDYKDLARRNGIDRGFTIYPGQKIYLSGTPAKVPSSVQPPPQSTVVLQRPNQPQPPRSKTTTIVRDAPTPASAPASKVVWQWPAPGRVLAGYSSHQSLHAGVDLDGRLGESVVAAADGVVVYAGSGIRGYGNLLIVKHSDIYLSAYAHNSKLLVHEKASVKRGQKIAEIGSTGTDRNKLHFEIRREGKPVDPLQYLPKR